MRILIAEDERIARRSLQRQLEGWGYEVCAAEDGAAAWELFQQQQFDLVVTDWDMPHMDGRQLVESIRGSGASSYVYLIMLTGRSEKSDLVEGMEAGADDFLAKPFDKSELRVRLNAGERIIRLERELAAHNETLSEANERMRCDLDAAAAVQRDLLPKELPESLGPKFAWYFEPCDELGGDILNVIPLSAECVAMYLLDVSGHGVPAALLSVTLSRVLNARDPLSSILMSHPGGDAPEIVRPLDVAHSLNRQFQMEDQGGRYFTMAYGVLNVDTGVMDYTLAGHPPPILVRRGRRPEQLSGQGNPIGILEDADFEAHKFALERGDRLFFYSDGITEAFNAAGAMLGFDGFSRILDKSRDLSLDECLPQLVADLRQWNDATPLADDISILAVEVAGS